MALDGHDGRLMRKVFLSSSLSQADTARIFFNPQIGRPRLILESDFSRSLSNHLNVEWSGSNDDRVNFWQVCNTVWLYLQLEQFHNPIIQKL